MLEDFVAQYVGKTVESVGVHARDTNLTEPIPFAVILKFTDGSILRTISKEIDGFSDRESGQRGFQFPG